MVKLIFVYWEMDISDILSIFGYLMHHQAGQPVLAVTSAWRVGWAGSQTSLAWPASYRSRLQLRFILAINPILTWIMNFFRFQQKKSAFVLYEPEPWHPLTGFTKTRVLHINGYKLTPFLCLLKALQYSELGEGEGRAVVPTHQIQTLCYNQEGGWKRLEGQRTIKILFLCQQKSLHWGDMVLSQEELAGFQNWYLQRWK